MNVYLYSRVSTDKQTLEQQEKTVFGWLNSHNMSVDEIVSDENVSGGVSYRDRNLGKKLLQKLKPNDVLIVSEISRLGRSMYDLNMLINEELKPRKVRLVIVSMGIDLNCFEMKAIDQLILSNFAFAAQLEIELNHDRTSHALQVRKELIKKQGYFVNKKGERCTGLGAASENYKKSESNIILSSRKSGNTRNTNTLNSIEFQSFCRILKRVFKTLQAKCDLLQESGELFMLSWDGMKDEILKNMTMSDIENILQQMKDAKADNKDLFKKYDLDTIDLKVIRAKIGNTFNTIKTYKLNNNTLMKKNLKDLQIGDKVYCTGDNSFCDSNIEIILGIGYNKIYNNKMHERVIYLEGDEDGVDEEYLVFDGITGEALTEPTAYYIQTIK